MDVYIELIKKFSTNGKKIIFIKDVAEVFATGVSAEEIKNIQLFTIKDTDYGVYKISSLDIYKAIISKFPSAKINNIGEKEVLVIFDSKKNFNGIKDCVCFRNAVFRYFNGNNEFS